MVQVKFKPQHLVFSMHPLVTGRKTLDFGCGKLVRPRLGAGHPGFRKAVEPPLPTSATPRIRRRFHPPSLVPGNTPNKDVSPVQFQVPMCILWVTRAESLVR
jgi:hypothetical protein